MDEFWKIDAGIYFNLFYLYDISEQPVFDSQNYRTCISSEEDVAEDDGEYNVMEYL